MQYNAQYSIHFFEVNRSSRIFGNLERYVLRFQINKGRFDIKNGNHH